MQLFNYLNLEQKNGSKLMMYVELLTQIVKIKTTMLKSSLFDYTTVVRQGANVLPRFNANFDLIKLFNSI